MKPKFNFLMVLALLVMLFGTSAGPAAAADPGFEQFNIAPYAVSFADDGDTVFSSVAGHYVKLSIQITDPALECGTVYFGDETGAATTKMASNVCDAPSHIYADPGDYIVTFTGTWSAGSWSFAMDGTTAAGNGDVWAPLHVTASLGYITWTPTAVLAGDIATFTAPDGYDQGYWWMVAPGPNQPCTDDDSPVGGQIVDHTFPVVTGKYEVCLMMGKSTVPGVSGDQAWVEVVSRDVLLVVADDDAVLDPWGKPAAWSRQAGTGYYPYILPHGAAMAKFNSFDAIHGARLVAGPFDLGGLAGPNVHFYMSHDSEWPRGMFGTYDDSLQVQVSTNGTDWTNVGPRLLRDDPTCNPGTGDGCWTEHTVYLPDANGIYLGFLGSGFLGHNIYLDDVTLPDGTAVDFEGEDFPPPTGWDQQGPVNTSPIQRMLREFGDLGAIDIFDAANGTPTLDELKAYDVVVTWSHDWYADAVTLGNNLADYIDWGGKVINLRESLGDSSPDESNLFVPAGRFPSYTAMWALEDTSGGTKCFNNTSTHPIMAGVTLVCDRATYGLTATDGSSVIANWYEYEFGSLPFVAAKDDHSVVSINAYVGYLYTWSGPDPNNEWNDAFSDQIDDVLHNAILWTLEPPPPAHSISGTVFDDADVDGAFDSGESGISGVTVGLFAGCSGSTPVETTTAADGSYTFSNVTGGQKYCLDTPPQTGYQVTLRPDAIQSLDADVTGMDFGLTNAHMFTWDPLTPDEGSSAAFAAVAGWSNYSWKVADPGSDCSLLDYGTSDVRLGPSVDVLFGASGQYQVCVKISGVGGLTLYDGQLVTVANVAPVVVSGPTVYPEPSNAGDPVSVEIAWSDADTLLCAIDYGDGTVVPGTVAASEPVCSGSHVYAAGGTYTIQFSLSDEVATTTASVSHLVNAPVVSADVGITKTDSKDPVKPGASLVYQLTVRNAGPNTAQSLRVMDTLDRSTTYSSVSAPKSWTCKYANYAVTCTSASLAKDASAIIKMTVTVNKAAKPGKELVNNAQVSSATLDPNLANNTVVQKTMVTK